MKGRYVVIVVTSTVEARDLAVTDNLSYPLHLVALVRAEAHDVSGLAFGGEGAR